MSSFPPGTVRRRCIGRCCRCVGSETVESASSWPTAGRRTVPWTFVDIGTSQRFTSSQGTCIARSTSPCASVILSGALISTPMTSSTRARWADSWHMAMRRESDIAYGDCDYIDGAGRFLFSFASAEPSQLLPLFRTGVFGFSQPAAIFKREVYERQHGFNKAYKLAADAEFFFRAILNGARASKLPGASVSGFRVQRTQLSKARAAEMEEEKERNQDRSRATRVVHRPRHCCHVAGVEPSALRHPVAPCRVSDWTPAVVSVARGRPGRMRIDYRTHPRESPTPNAWSCVWPVERCAGPGCRVGCPHVSAAFVEQPCMH